MPSAEEPNKKGSGRPRLNPRHASPNSDVYVEIEMKSGIICLPIRKECLVESKRNGKGSTTNGTYAVFRTN
jgi:hypothetical protein